MLNHMAQGKTELAMDGRAPHRVRSWLPDRDHGARGALQHDQGLSARQVQGRVLHPVVARRHQGNDFYKSVSPLEYN